MRVPRALEKAGAGRLRARVGCAVHAGRWQARGQVVDGDLPAQGRPLDGPRGAPAGPLSSVIALVVFMACLAMLGFGSSPAWAADGCPNAGLRAQNNSTRLPDCRAYEMVSPSYKEGFAINQQSFSDEGAVSFTSLGLFAGSTLGVLATEYFATRSSAGWTTVAPAPPAGTFQTTINPATEGPSADFGKSLWITRRLVAPVDAETYYYYLRGPDGSMTRVGPGAVPGMDELPYTQGFSADLSHILFTHGASYGAGSAADAALYEFVGTGNNGPARPVSVDNHGQQVPAEACPAGTPRLGRGARCRTMGG